MVKEKIIAVYSNWNYFSELSIIVIKGNEHIFYVHALCTHVYFCTARCLKNERILLVISKAFIQICTKEGPLVSRENDMRNSSASNYSNLNCSI